jgi:hypothetical protein
MTDFTLVKKYLLEIIDLKPEALGDNLNGHVQGFSPSMPHTLLTSQIFSKLISYPKGQSISKNGMTRVVLLSVLTLDELVLSNTSLPWEEYVDFRFKAFSLFVENEKDPEAGELYNNLSEVINKLSPNSLLRQKLKQQVKNYKRIIVRKIKRLEASKQFDKASLLNSMYSVVPDYAYEPRIEEKERKYFEWHFLEPVYKIIVEVLFVLFVYGINLLIIKRFEKGDLFAFFAKGNFSIYDLLFGLALIFLLFWIFKLLDHQYIRTLWRNIIKGSMIIIALVAIEGYIIYKYNSEYKNFFPSVQNKNVLQGKYNDQVTRILVTKFMPLEKTTIFSKDYSDINISQLFYKNILTQTINKDGSLDSTILIDYFPDSYTIEKREDMEHLYQQGKYDVIISGDFVKEREKEIKIFSTLFVIDSILLKTIDDMKNMQLNSADYSENILFSFLTLNNTPFEYYLKVCSLANIREEYKIVIDVHCGLDFNVGRDFSPELSIVSTIEKSPLICIDYIKIIKLFNSRIESPPDFEKISKLIDDILLWNKESDSLTSIKQKILILHMYQLKTFKLNQKIECNLNHEKNYKDLFSDWILKIDYINLSIDLLCDINKIDEFTRKSLIYYNSFINMYYLRKIYLKNKKSYIEIYKKFEDEYNDRIQILKRQFFEIENISTYKLYENDSNLNRPYKTIKSVLDTLVINTLL